MKKRITALLVATITALAAMPAYPVFADTIELEEVPQSEEAEPVLFEASEDVAEPVGIEAVEAGEDLSFDAGINGANESGEAAEGGNIDPFVDNTSQFVEEPETSDQAGDLTSFVGASPIKRTLNCYVSYKGNDESRSYYYYDFNSIPKNISYNTSIGTMRYIKYKYKGNTKYALKFTFDKNEKRTATVSYKYEGKSYKIRFVPVKYSFSRAAKNIKIHKIRLAGFDKNFRFSERTGKGRVEVEPVSGWKVTTIYKSKMFDANAKKQYYNNGDKVTLNQFDRLSICLQNTKTKKVTWYGYNAMIKGK